MSTAKQPAKKKAVKNSTKYIFVVGGVMSGVGKGVTTASIGQILQARGYKRDAGGYAKSEARPSRTDNFSCVLIPLLQFIN